MHIQLFFVQNGNFYNQRILKQNNYFLAGLKKRTFLLKGIIILNVLKTQKLFPPKVYIMGQCKKIAFEKDGTTKFA